MRVVGRDVSREDGFQLTLEALDFEKIKGIEILPEDEAKNIALEAFQSSELWPLIYFKPTLATSGATFYAEDVDGRVLADQMLDVKVSLNTNFEGLPIIGPGANVHLVFNGQRQSTSLLCW